MASKNNLPYRLLFIESVCTDEAIITENILRSKCENDDFKGVKNTNEVIAEFHERIEQYEKVYEPLEPSEGVSYIKIINVKRHVILHKVHHGLGSRIAFFLLNLHPVAFPIFIALPGETIGDEKKVFGGDERLTVRGEAYARALKQFIQDRIVPNMIILHGTNNSVLHTLRPLLEDEMSP
uniref:Putative 6-phosphofructo-2-kinase/fructose-2,6-bisphosphatase n=1 Tax=Lygus hesperus TaxID=30085 RepID=A0A0A9X378_LYGHE